MRLETERLIIRSFVEQDIDRFAELVADPEVMKNIGGGETQGRSEAEAYVRRCIAREAETGVARYALADKSSGEFVGFCGYAPDEHGTDLGWRLFRDRWGRGLATEAARAVLDYGLRELKLADIFAHAFADNAASVRIMEKLRLQFVEEDYLYGRRVVRYRPSA